MVPRGLSGVPRPRLMQHPLRTVIYYGLPSHDWASWPAAAGKLFNLARPRDICISLTSSHSDLRSKTSKTFVLMLQPSCSSNCTNRRRCHQLIMKFNLLFLLPLAISASASVTGRDGGGGYSTPAWPAYAETVTVTVTDTVSKTATTTITDTVSKTATTTVTTYKGGYWTTSTAWGK